MTLEPWNPGTLGPYDPLEMRDRHLRGPQDFVADEVPGPDDADHATIVSKDVAAMVETAS